MTLELIQLITDKNNLNDVDTWMFSKWAFKSAAAVLIVTNTWNIVMGVFDAAQSVVGSASGIIPGDTESSYIVFIPITRFFLDLSYEFLSVS